MLNERCEAINKSVREIWGVNWDLIQEDIDLTVGVYRHDDPLFGPRIVQEGWKVGTSSWVLSVCKRVDLLEVSQIEAFGFKKPKLAVAQIVNVQELRKHFSKLPEYWCQPIDLDQYFPTYNWNPIPLKSKEDAANYLTGWTY